MPSVEEIARQIVSREGGFVNDPDDPGGATNRGVTIGTMRKLGLDLDRDGDVDVDDVKLVSEKLAIEIFVRNYFEKPKIRILPECLHDTVFDMYVNAGGNAVKILQRMINRLGYSITVDGALGSQTAGAAHALSRLSETLLRDAYGVERREYYYALADGRPASRKYARRKDGGKGGWIVRAEEFISPRFHLSLEQHKERTAKWA